MSPTGKGALRIAIEDFFTTTKIGKWLSGWYTDLIEDVEAGIIAEYSKQFDEIAKIPGLNEYFDVNKLKSGAGKHQGAAASILGFGLNLGMGAASAFMAPLFRLLNYKIDQKVHSARLDPNIIAQAMWKAGSLPQSIIDDCKDLGYDDERMNTIRAALTSVMDPSGLMALYQRGEIDTVKFYSELGRLGFTGQEKAWFDKLSHIIPGVQDLISMAVREAWNDETSARFHYDAELPPEAAEWAQKEGLDPVWFKRYWRAHWQLISPSQGFEMLHRLRPGTTDTPFSEDDLLTLLKTADFPEFFRQRLMKISYNPYTRVDVRRMYKLGILTEEDVYNSYRDIGYDDQHAKNLTSFTIKYETETDKTKIEEARDLTQGTIISAYQKKVIDRDKAAALLADLKYEPDSIEIILKAAEFAQVVNTKPNYELQFVTELKGLIDKAYTSREITKDQAITMLKSIHFTGKEIGMLLDNDDFQYEKSVLADTLNLVGRAYIKHAMTEGDVIQVLGENNISGAQQAQLFNEWEQQRTYRSDPLSESQYRACMLKGIITGAEYKEALQGLGYSDKSIELLIKLYAPAAPVTPPAGTE